MKEIPGIPGYAADKEGNIYSLNYRGKGITQKLKYSENKRGYKQVGLSGGNHLVHVLVARTFLGFVPCGHELTVDHIDENKKNNKVSNLQILTDQENKEKSLWKRDLPRFVYRHGNRYIARNKKEGIYLGYFNTPEEAKKALQQHGQES